MESLELRANTCCDLISAYAITNPKAVAVAEGYRQLTYGELEGRANQLAQLLRERGVSPDAVVGLCIRRSQEFIIAALGILKAGAAYLPLDPDYPANRLSMLLSDSGAGLVVTHSSAAQQVPSGTWQTIIFDPSGTVTASYPRTAPDVKTGPDNLAYVIYTSGSTGRPKGVEITHANLTNLIRWHQREFSITENDRATFHASLGFDAAVWEIWPYLAAGACIYLVDDRIRTAPEALHDWIVTNGITASFLPTALAEEMVERSWPKETQLRFLLTGADTLRRRPPAGLPFVFVNNYGPTECTVVSTSGVVNAGDISSELPSIGKPIDNVQAYVVDEDQQPVPPGTPGELLIGGANVGRGYLNLPELTAQKFIRDPFSGKPNARLYRTGDLVRYLPNGEIAFMGRIDDQIKIRGYRIEPEEVIAALNDHPDVDLNVVIAQVEPAGDKRLVAYVVAKENIALSARTLRESLAERLPDYMIPSTFVQVEQLPVSASGKLDRATLPAPTADNTLHEDAYEAPQTEIQERVALIVANLLGVERVGIDDNFFSMGGHSLLGAQMIARISDTFGVELSLLSVFDDPTVRGMSAEIERLFLAKLESMSEEEAQRLLAAQAGN
ncbi:MAG: non-ribosomal peptide synthetase [Candidatus Sulfotelmatobacter sp.]